jgi:hypothetical protein
MGLETLELAHGVIWSQGLHYRDPQLQSVPEPLKSELRSALDAIAVRSTCADQLYDGRETALTPQDILHAHSSRAYSVIKEIRSTPGFERFMLGETYESLCTAASAHPVVVLVGARGSFYALIIAPSKTHGHALLSLDLTDKDTQDISPTYDSTRAQRSAAPPQDNFSEIDRAMKRIMPKRSDMPLGRQSKVLWLKVVKPVLDHLNLKVSVQYIVTIDRRAEAPNSLRAAVSARACTGARLVSSTVSHYMQPASMTHHKLSALPTM